MLIKGITAVIIAINIELGIVFFSNFCISLNANTIDLDLFIICIHLLIIITL